MARNARPVDPVLTNMSLQYRNEEGFMADFIMPEVTKQDEATGTYFTFDARGFFQTADDLVANRAEANDVDYDMSSATYHTTARGIRAKYTKDEEAESSDPSRLAENKARVVAETMRNNREKRVIDIVTNTSNITQTSALSGTDQWNDASSDPHDQITLAIKTIHSGTGKRPNRMVVGWDVWFDGLANNAEIVSRVQASQLMGGLGDVTPALVGQLFGVDLRVSSAQYASSDEGQTLATSYMFGKNALLYYAEDTPQLESASLGYTIVSRPWEVKRPYMSNDGETIFVETRYNSVEKLVAAGVGYLFTTVVA